MLHGITHHSCHQLLVLDISHASLQIEPASINDDAEEENAEEEDTEDAKPAKVRAPVPKDVERLRQVCR